MHTQEELTVLRRELQSVQEEVEASRVKASAETQEKEKAVAMLNKAVEKCKALSTSGKEDKRAFEAQVQALQHKIDELASVNESNSDKDDQAMRREKRIHDLEIVVQQHDEVIANYAVQADDQVQLLKAKDRRVEVLKNELSHIS